MCIANLWVLIYHVLLWAYSLLRLCALVNFLESESVLLFFVPLMSKNTILKEIYRPASNLNLTFCFINIKAANMKVHPHNSILQEAARAGILLTLLTMLMKADKT
jgi:hypothetical protein